MINLAQNLRHSLAGLRAACADRSFRAELLLGAVLLPAVSMSNASLGYKLAVAGIYLLLLALELVNTAIEGLCDLITLEHHLGIKAVKDMASAAVFLVLIVLLTATAIALTGVPLI